MKVKIYPSRVSGKITIPPSKSMGHRAIICASLGGGKSTISNISFSDDIVATIGAMEILGAKIKKYEDTLEIYGIGTENFENLDISENTSIDCLESGSTLRFLIPLFSLTCKKIRFIGKNRLFKRPQHIYEEIFKSQNLEFIQEEDGILIDGKIKSGKFTLKGDVSSQFISGLLFTLPLLEKSSEIRIIPPFESKSYVLLTMDMLKKFGIETYFKDEYTIFIKGNQKYLSCDYEVEGDFSQLGFFATLGALNSTLECDGLNIHSHQGDMEIIDILKRCGIKIDTLDRGYRFYKNTPSSIDINLENCPDLGPILTVLCAFGSGDFKIYNAKRLRLKESDRIEAMESELKKIGVHISSNADNIYIRGGKNYVCKEILSGHKDHRIVMSLCVLATLLDTPVVIDEGEYISKSYPDFFSDLKKIGVKLEILEN